jgi:acetyltransferase-like isoleucine patch superfamily enzyme
MNRILSWTTQQLRGEEFLIDDRIPISYIISLLVRMGTAFIRGLVLFGSLRAVVFVERGAIIRCKSKISMVGFAKFGIDSYVDALSKEGIALGRGFSLGRGASIECTGSFKSLGVGLKVGNNVGIGSFSFLGCAGGISIGSDTIFGNYVSLHSENHNFVEEDIPLRLQGVNRKGIVIGENCWLGAKSTILDGVMLGNNCIVAAGSVVVEGRYEDNSLIGGVPAKYIKKVRQ